MKKRDITSCIFMIIEIMTLIMTFLKNKSIQFNFHCKTVLIYFQKRVMVYPNGESVERALYVWGESIEEILECATVKLNLWAQAKYLYDMEGNKVSFT